MADTPSTPPTPPAPPRRKAATGPRKSTRTTPSKVKAKAAGAEGAVTTAAKKTTPRKAPTRKASAPKASGVTTRARNAAKSVGATAGNAANRVADGASSARRSVAQSAPVQRVSDTRERMGDRNFFAALIGGVAAVGAAIGGIFYAVKAGGAGNGATSRSDTGSVSGAHASTAGEGSAAE